MAQVLSTINIEQKNPIDVRHHPTTRILSTVLYCWRRRYQFLGPGRSSPVLCAMGDHDVIGRRFFGISRDKLTATPDIITNKLAKDLI